MLDWYPAAQRDHGPANKTGGYGFVEPSIKVGIVAHSAEGSLQAALNVLATGPTSWHFTNPKSGGLLQHYQVGMHCWASGGPHANVPYVAIEHEGKAGEPLTDSQTDNLVSLIRWLADGFSWFNPSRPLNSDDLGAELYEHREMVRFGSSPTACPSGRIPWPTILAKLSAPPLPSVERVLQALQAALATTWTFQDFDHVPPHDRDVIRQILKL